MSNEVQKSIFETVYETLTGKKNKYEWELRVDGASRGNPGKAGAGIYLKKDTQDRVKAGFVLGKKTNNEAEYLALLIGVMLLKKEIKPGEGVTIISDSQLLIRQLDATYKVRKPELQQLHAAIFSELGTIKALFKHVEREYNTVADALANKGIDENITLPLKMLDTLRSYEIFI
ncbi:MAG: ribonuclease HI family protein [Candidatus Babeliales bacterium]